MLHRSISNDPRALCKVTFKGKTVELKYAACYVMNDYDEATKCVLFSDRPIDQNKLQQLLLKKGNQSMEWTFPLTHHTCSTFALEKKAFRSLPNWNHSHWE